MLIVHGSLFDLYSISFALIAAATSELTICLTCKCYRRLNDYYFAYGVGLSGNEGHIRSRLLSFSPYSKQSIIFAVRKLASSEVAAFMGVWKRVLGLSHRLILLNALASS